MSVNGGENGASGQRDHWGVGVVEEAEEKRIVETQPAASDQSHVLRPESPLEACRDLSIRMPESHLTNLGISGQARVESFLVQIEDEFMTVSFISCT